MLIGLLLTLGCGARSSPIDREIETDAGADADSDSDTETETAPVGHQARPAEICGIANLQSLGLLYFGCAPEFSCEAEFVDGLLDLRPRVRDVADCDGGPFWFDCPVPMARPLFAGISVWGERLPAPVAGIHGAVPDCFVLGPPLPDGCEIEGFMASGVCWPSEVQANGSDFFRAFNGCGCPAADYREAGCSLDRSGSTLSFIPFVARCSACADWAVCREVETRCNLYDLDVGSYEVELPIEVPGDLSMDVVESLTAPREEVCRP